MAKGKVWIKITLIWSMSVERKVATKWTIDIGKKLLYPSCDPPPHGKAALVWI